ncbi:MAG: YbaN family protein [Fidelibacterota bacterium]|nr:MAG: YbaN family protein [Candidatus Neomarinimicrobiota bacterium]
MLGIFLPLLPTTPFLLLAAACYIRSSDKFYHWLIANRWFGRYIRNYREGRGVPLSTKVIAIGLLWITIGYSVFFMVDILALRILLILIAVGVTTHLVLLKTYRRHK